jgi:sterol desaturase/sphingolipid hydroxylase (fatty acid hydroxylase superfamily)
MIKEIIKQGSPGWIFVIVGFFIPTIFGWVMIFLGIIFVLIHYFMSKKKEEKANA